VEKGRRKGVCCGDVTNSGCPHSCLSLSLSFDGHGGEAQRKGRRMLEELSKMVDQQIEEEE